MIPFKRYRCCGSCYSLRSYIFSYSFEELVAVSFNFLSTHNPSGMLQVLRYCGWGSLTWTKQRQGNRHQGWPFFESHQRDLEPQSPCHSGASGDKEYWRWVIDIHYLALITIILTVGGEWYLLCNTYENKWQIWWYTVQSWQISLHLFLFGGEWR